MRKWGKQALFVVTFSKTLVGDKDSSKVIHVSAVEETDGSLQNEIQLRQGRREERGFLQ